MKTKRNLQLGFATLSLMLTLGACSQPLSNRERGALIGGGAGAAGGALIGGITGAPGTGALIGGAAGAVGGALVGDERDRQRRNY
jgi:outer membrane lipoprotein SlyB